MTEAGIEPTTVWNPNYPIGIATIQGDTAAIRLSGSRKAWHFARRLRPSHGISYTGMTNRLIPPSFSDSPVVKKNNKQERELLKEYRELLGLTSSFAREEERSRFISQATSYFDPRISSLFEFGNARLSETVRWKVRLRIVPIAALATGENGNVLSFCAIDDEPIYGRYEDGSNFRVPTISTSNTVDWVCGEAPIKQIRFAESFEESECLFAVRLQSRTSIFRPIYYQEPLVINPPQTAEGTHSKAQLAHIDPNLMTEIDVSQTGGYTHVDVAFNPWYQKQFAVIDDRGNWSVWLLHNFVKHREGVTPERQHSGSLPSSDITHHDDTAQIPHDGWGIIQWTGNMYTFIACSRRIAMLYVLEDATPVPYDIKMNWQSSTEWILDVKTSLRKPSHVFILTTLRILCFDISSRDHESSFLLPQFSRQHDRDADDLTLRFTSLSLGQAFQVLIDDSDDSNSSMSDPFRVYVPGIADTNGLDTIRYDFPIRQIQLKELEQTPYSLREKFTPRESFMKLFVLDSALAVHQYIFSKPYDPSSLDGEKAINREIMSFGKALELFRRREGHTAMRTIFNDESDKAASRKSRSKTRTNSQLTVDLNKIYALLCTGDTRYVKKSLVAALEFQSFREYVEHLVTAVSTSVEDGPPYMQTMLEAIKNPPTSSDIDDIIQWLEWFRSKFAPVNISTEITLCFLPLQISANPLQGKTRVIRSLQPLDLLGLYNKLVGDWLSPLDGSIPSWTRIFKEKLIRQVSIDLSLASIIQVDVSGSDGDTVASSQISFPQRESSVKDQADTPNTMTEQADDHDMLELKTVSPPIMDVPATGAAHEVLSHWVIGGNPESFDWVSVFTMDTGEKDSRPRLKSRTRTRSRSRAPSEGLKVLRSSPVAPTVAYPGSQPQQSFSRLPLPSSQISEDMLPMTQIERGLFGSREAGKKSNAKARKKKRAAGF
ncbi:hypothetical protein UA08_04358 [Talaromyces atroroseus]|uniref:RNA polymerase I-specific transcription initiation factor RRN6-like protein n=1 Tax=Talaromyces atroroseus TaxID=1441469 RepID=A0A1Q5Q902_TALAT|nr:hypothetical protein UA08_04358 [Talaromyces atroroseus]OKL60594.1 hypothetical protein UA08_04358 [Talaromyces atroroseus]